MRHNGTTQVQGTDSFNQPTGERDADALAGGVLVYESRGIGRELVGFEDVDDWSDLRSGLAARGHDVGAIHHLPVLDGGA